MFKQVTSNCFKNFLCCQKLKQKVKSPFLHNFSVNTFFQAQTQCQQGFSDFSVAQTSILNVKIHFNCAVEELLSNLQLELINLQYNDVLKGKNQEEI